MQIINAILNQTNGSLFFSARNNWGKNICTNLINNSYKFISSLHDWHAVSKIVNFSNYVTNPFVWCHFYTHVVFSRGATAAPKYTRKCECERSEITAPMSTQSCPATALRLWLIISLFYRKHEIWARLCITLGWLRVNAIYSQV